jgi:DNA-binding transcriptional ArsR family regulator
MVQSKTVAIFRALGDASRLEIVSRLTSGPRTATELVAPLGMTLQAVRKHLAVLEGAGVVSTQKRGRVRLCRLEPGPLKDAEAWMRSRVKLWERRLDALGAIFEEEETP